MAFVFWTNCSTYPNLLSKCIENQYISISCRNISLHLKAVYLVPTEKLHVHFCTTSLHLKPKKAQTVLHSVAFSKLMPVIFNVFSFPEENIQSRCPSFGGWGWGLAAFVWMCICFPGAMSERMSIQWYIKPCCVRSQWTNIFARFILHLGLLAVMDLTVLAFKLGIIKWTSTLLRKKCTCYTSSH